MFGRPRLRVKENTSMYWQEERALEMLRCLGAKSNKMAGLRQRNAPERPGEMGMI